MKYKWEIIFIFVLFAVLYLLSACEVKHETANVVVGGKQLTQAQIDAKIQELKDNQDTYYRLYNKYQGMEKTTYNNLQFKIDEYQYPNGQKGYNIFLNLFVDGDGTYFKQVASGTEIITTDWVKVYSVSSSTL